MKTFWSGFVGATMLLVLYLVPPVTDVRAQSTKQFIAYSDAKPLFDSLRADFLPSDLRDRTPAAREALWADWVARRDADIRRRVEEGDEDSIVYLLMFGTTFTRQPPISERELAGLVVQKDATETFVPSPVLTARVADFIKATAAPGTNERLQFAAAVMKRHRIDPVASEGARQMQQYLEERVALVGRADRRSRLLDPKADVVDKLTIFRDRGLSSDTSIPIDFGIEQALDDLKASGVLRAGTVARAAIVGPGLEFVDKQSGYDFYPPQTIQPFALIDSLQRFELAAPDLAITAFDLSPRVLQHLDAARMRARTGVAYTLVLPRGTDRPWSQELIDYWQRSGNWIGDGSAKVPPVPPGAGRLEVRGVSIRPPAVLSVIPADLNVVAERAAGGPFDLIVATNILLYYDVFEQSLAAANIASMLRPGGILLTNNPIFELPDSPLSGVGSTDVVYMSLPDVGNAGDRIVWYRKTP